MTPDGCFSRTCWMFFFNSSALTLLSTGEPHTWPFCCGAKPLLPNEEPPRMRSTLPPPEQNDPPGRFPVATPSPAACGMPAWNTATRTAPDATSRVACMLDLVRIPSASCAPLRWPGPGIAAAPIAGRRAPSGWNGGEDSPVQREGLREGAWKLRVHACVALPHRALDRPLLTSKVSRSNCGARGRVGEEIRCFTSLGTHMQWPAA